VDDPTVRRFAEAHADAVVRGDQAALDDFAPQARSLVTTIVRALPRPITGAEVVRVEKHGATTLVDIRYDGEGASHTVVRSEWSGDERPRIISATLT
jgi:hypothetical protein